ncbi:hypothetical protein ACFO1B_46505 [Dactylosporangium siamense]|uniref:Uncharacterized protein n=1 Tax=Dactylosporangium siamense TaxID=685454 RepID=A0A919UI75_9ACTN|nr:hypothetical protein [Dactylosporangium siamense]GIG51418.1 hypothetical protein Dsi01nite_094590 [Dactylosporangium siamense]
MRIALAVVCAVLFVGAMAWLHHITGRSVFLVLAGVTTGVLIRLEPRRAHDVAADQASAAKKRDAPGAP